MVADDIFNAGKGNAQAELRLLDNINEGIKYGVLDENIVASELQAVLREVRNGAIESVEGLAKFLEKNLWKNGVKCGYCGSKNVSNKIKKTGFRRCRDCRKQFNVRTGTIFHKSKLPLTKWLYAVYLTQTGRKGISSLELSKKLGITQKSAWFMWHRIREACKQSGGQLSGSVQVDETWFGGLSNKQTQVKT